MRERLVAIIVVLVMMFTLTPAAIASNQAEAEPVLNCETISLSTDQVKVVCSAAGVVVVNTVVDLPRVPVPGPTVTATVRVPGPESTRTIEVRVPGPTQSVTAPGTVRTVTAAPSTVTAAGPTRTVTDESTQTVTATATVQATATVTSSPTGQVDNESATMDPEQDGGLIESIDTPAEAAGIGLLSLLALILIVLGGMWAGYYLGYKDSDAKEASFMRALLDKVK